MNAINVSCIPTNGVIEIFLGAKYDGYIGLVDISLPCLDRQRTIVSISCDQVDSTCFNRKRILRRVCTDNSIGYQTHQFYNPMYYKLDSSDYKLTIRLFDERGPLQFTTPEPVLMTVNLQHEYPKHWLNMWVSITEPQLRKNRAAEMFKKSPGLGQRAKKYKKPHMQ